VTIIGCEGIDFKFSVRFVCMTDYINFFLNLLALHFNSLVILKKKNTMSSAKINKKNLMNILNINCAK